MSGEFDSVDEYDSFSYLTYLVIMAGSWFIFDFLFSEYRLASKKSKNKEVRFTWSEQFHYRLDYYLSTSPLAKLVLLLSGTFLLITFGAALLALVSGHSISSSTWVAWTYVADPGTHADAEGTLVRMVSFVITIGGMLVFALMIGIISDAIGEKVDEMKKGKSRVIESGHTLMLGWNDKSLAIIQQIAFANESEGGGVIVVLAEQDKEELEEIMQAAIDLREHNLELHGTIVVFRSGNPLMEYDLEKVSVLTARSIIALSPEESNPDESDSRMVRQVLALKAFENLKSHVVVEMQDVDNKDLVRLVAPDFAEVIVAHDIIGRLMIQCAREPGLAYVLESLMGFEGDEFYIENWKKLIGKTFLDITCRFDDAIPIGIKTKEGRIKINPENSYVLKKGDEILCLAEDNDTYTVNDGSYDVKCGNIPIALVPKQEKEKMLFCGWRRDMADMIMQLDEYVAEGSELWLFNSVPVQERKELLKDKGNKDELQLKHLTIKNAVGNPIVRRDLRLLQALDNNGHPTGDTITLDEFDSLLILADAVAIENGADMQSSDSRSLASLLIIQDIQNQLLDDKKKKSASEARTKVKDTDDSTEDDDVRDKDGDGALIKSACVPISEILDTRTRSLLHLANCKGYVMSNQIVSAAIAQVSEDRDMNAVLGELLSAEGCESYIRDISHYVDVEKEGKKSFWDVALRARQRREVAVGYKPCDLSFREEVDLILNPPNKAKKRKWRKGDKIIVFAFD